MTSLLPITHKYELLEEMTPIADHSVKFLTAWIDL